MKVPAPRHAWLLALLLLLLAGCASPPRALPPGEPVAAWSGRLALQVEDEPDQSFSAMFDLRGSAQAGELTLSNPIGGTLAVLSWTPGFATLRNNGQTHEFHSVDALVRKATGSDIPVAALFDWLRGVPTAVPGWQPDLSQLARGRISAMRVAPPPPASLRVAIDR
ncbi:MAG TPA: outer membrane lipoprotein LolB [Ramlibacter sp.]|nr:outer membrane lipoprotein LolB [Ramlibacter sp.]